MIDVTPAAEGIYIQCVPCVFILWIQVQDQLLVLLFFNIILVKVVVYTLSY